MEIKDLILLMWRNVQTIILGLALGAGIGFAVSRIETPVYEASTKVFVSRARQQSNSDMLSLSDEQLLAINLQLAKSPPVLNEVSSQLGSKVDTDNIQVGAITNTLIIQIKVQDNDPQRAATIANLLVQILIQENETLLTGRYTGFENALDEQIDQVQKQMDGLQIQISQINDAGIQEQLTQVTQQIEQLKIEIYGLEQEISIFPDTLTALERISLAEKQAQLDQFHSLMTLYQQIQTNLIYIGKPGQNGLSLENPQLATLQSTLDLYQQMNLTLINSRENVRLARTQNRQNVMQIVSAIPPKNPVRPMPVLYFLLGGMVGLSITATAILVIDHLDESLKSADQIEKLLDIPLRGLVSNIKHTENGLVTIHDPYSAEAEAFRALGASIEISSAEKGIHTLLVANAGPGEDKTSIAANLAVVNAQQGKKVILVDGDLKHPHLHSLFGMEILKGLADIINGKLDVKSVFHPVENVAEMILIPSGIAENDSTGWLDAEKLTQLLLELQRQADLVVVDSPSSDTADAQVLASKVDAVLLVVKSGQTRVDSTQATLSRFQLIGARVIGAVLNSTPQSRRIHTKIPPLSKIKQHSREDFHGVK